MGGREIVVFELIKPCKERKKGMCNSGSLIDEGCLNTVGAFRRDKRGIFCTGFTKSRAELPYCTLRGGEAA